MDVQLEIPNNETLWGYPDVFSKYKHDVKLKMGIIWALYIIFT